MLGACASTTQDATYSPGCTIFRLTHEEQNPPRKSTVAKPRESGIKTANGTTDLHMQTQLTELNKQHSVACAPYPYSLCCLAWCSCVRLLFPPLHAAPLHAAHSRATAAAPRASLTRRYATDKVQQGARELYSKVKRCAAEDSEHCSAMRQPSPKRGSLRACP